MVLVDTWVKKGKQSIRKKWVSCHSVIPIPVLGSSRDSQVHSTKFALKKVKKKSWLPKNLDPAERIDVLLFNKFPCQKHPLSQSADKPEFYYTH